MRDGCQLTVRLCVVGTEQELSEGDRSPVSIAVRCCGGGAVVAMFQGTCRAVRSAARYTER